MSVELKGVGVGYRDNVLLESVDECFAEGQLTALVGRNGCGKSTLLRTIVGLMPPLRGEVEVCGVSLGEVSRQTLSTLVGYVNTERVLTPNLSCRDLVRFGRAPYTGWWGSLSAEDEAMAEDAIVKVGLWELRDRDVSTLSDGEAQRAMIARVLCQNTPVIVLDEPTAFLDLPNRVELCRLLGQLAHGERKTIIFSTHDLGIAMRTCDKISVLANRSIQTQTPQQIAQSGIVEKIFGISVDYCI